MKILIVSNKEEDSKPLPVQIGLKKAYPDATLQHVYGVPANTPLNEINGKVKSVLNIRQATIDIAAIEVNMGGPGGGGTTIDPTILDSYPDIGFIFFYTDCANIQTFNEAVSKKTNFLGTSQRKAFSSSEFITQLQKNTTRFDQAAKGDNIDVIDGENQGPRAMADLTSNGNVPEGTKQLTSNSPETKPSDIAAPKMKPEANSAND